ncbi:hypothetical protein TUBRATIS_14240 [Tubulinosema ratisbonensis]|uniref:Uncharacterized protein n=1 Tax=Tubulinosema ratisbonensis TaxID=291195 RepID=A0A437ALM2_9MICR|nr:hypothetical protein TUBRATIS_14240 [Tubulinosema ratisbonensis]
MLLIHLITVISTDLERNNLKTYFQSLKKEKTEEIRNLNYQNYCLELENVKLIDYSCILEKGPSSEVSRELIKFVKKFKEVINGEWFFELYKTKIDNLKEFYEKASFVLSDDAKKSKTFQSIVHFSKFKNELTQIADKLLTSTNFKSFKKRNMVDFTEFDKHVKKYLNEIFEFEDRLFKTEPSMYEIIMNLIDSPELKKVSAFEYEEDLEISIMTKKLNEFREQFMFINIPLDLNVEKNMMADLYYDSKEVIKIIEESQQDLKSLVTKLEKYIPLDIPDSFAESVDYKKSLIGKAFVELNKLYETQRLRYLQLTSKIQEKAYKLEKNLKENYYLLGEWISFMEFNINLYHAGFSVEETRFCILNNKRRYKNTIPLTIKVLTDDKLIDFHYTIFEDIQKNTTLTAKPFNYIKFYKKVYDFLVKMKFDTKPYDKLFLNDFVRYEEYFQNENLDKLIDDISKAQGRIFLLVTKPFVFFDWVDKYYKMYGWIIKISILIFLILIVRISIFFIN